MGVFHSNPFPSTNLVLVCIHHALGLDLAMRSKLLSWNAVARDCRASQVVGGILPTMPKSMNPMRPSLRTNKLPAARDTHQNLFCQYHRLKQCRKR